MRGFNATSVDEMLDILWHDFFPNEAPPCVFCIHRYRLMDDERVGNVCRGLGKSLHRCCKETYEDTITFDYFKSITYFMVRVHLWIVIVRELQIFGLVVSDPHTAIFWVCHTQRDMIEHRK